MPSTRRHRSLLALASAALLLGTLALPAAAQAPPATSEAAHHPFAHLFRCLSFVKLTDAQKADIKAIFEAARPQAEAILATLRTDREALAAALQASPPDPCAVGTAALKLHADREAARGFFEGVRDQVFAVLTAEQKAKVLGCLAVLPRAAAVEAGAGEEPTE
jgi:Spy/CpxP family protein refolding chaperone